MPRIQPRSATCKAHTRPALVCSGSYFSGSWLAHFKKSSSFLLMFMKWVLRTYHVICCLLIHFCASQFWRPIAGRFHIEKEHSVISRMWRLRGKERKNKEQKCSKPVCNGAERSEVQCITTMVSAAPNTLLWWIRRANRILFPKVIPSSVHGAIAVKWSPNRLIPTCKLTALKSIVQ